MKEYTFFFDESFHDRIIKLNKDGSLNTMVDNALDSYIGLFWGCQNDKLIEITNKLNLFENKYRNTFGLDEKQELKSQIIAKKNYNFGVHSFNHNTFDFYNDLFTIVEKSQLILQIEIISKLEIVVRHLYRNIILDKRNSILEDSFVYSLTKFISVYHTRELLDSLFEIHDNKTGYRFRKKLLQHLKCVMESIHNIERKQREYPALKQLYYIIYRSRIMSFTSKEFLFTYDSNFRGLSLLLNELNIENNNVSIVIDNDERTFQAAQKYSFYHIEQVDSKESVQVRLSDWISGFIGRMIYAIQNDKNMLEEKIDRIEDVNKIDISTKRILSQEWFALSERQYYLYLLIFKSLIVGQEHYWTAMTTINCDCAVLFFELIKYFATYKSFEEYSSIAPNLHAEYYNSRLLSELENYFLRIEHR